MIIPDACCAFFRIQVEENVEVTQRNFEEHPWRYRFQGTDYLSEHSSFSYRLDFSDYYWTTRTC